MNMQKWLLIGFGFLLTIEQGYTVVLGVLSNGVARGADIIMPVDLMMYGLLMMKPGKPVPAKLKGLHSFALTMAFIYLLWSSVGEVVAFEKADFRFALVHLSRAIFVFYTILSRITDRQDVIEFTKGVVFGLGFEAFIGVWQWQIGPVTLPFINVVNEWRATGTIGVGNAFGCYLAMLTPIAIRMALFTNIKPKWIWSIISVFSLASLLATYTRGAWLSLSVSLLFFFYLDFTKKKLSRKQINLLIAAFVVGITLTAIKYGDTIAGRMEDSAEAINSDKKHSRMGLAKDAIRIIKSNPITGVGLNQYRYHADEDIQGTRIVHNVYLLIAAQQGLPGIAIFLALNITLFVAGFKIRKSKDPLLYHIGMGGLAGMMSNFIYYLAAPDYRLVILKLHHWRAAAMLLAILIVDDHTTQVRRKMMMRKKMIAQQKMQQNQQQEQSKRPHHETAIQKY